MIQLLHLPTEVLRLILQHIFDLWDLRITKSLEEGGYRVNCEGPSNEGISQTCRLLHDEAELVIRELFSGRLVAGGHDGNHVGTLCDAFIGYARAMGKYRLVYFINRVSTLRFVNQGRMPSLWKIRMAWENYPSLRRIELDCRYRFHFAIHSIPSMDLFLNCHDGELAKCMDFRKSFFLSCEKFIGDAVSRGLIVTVIREMGVREGKERCHAVVVAADYVQDQFCPRDLPKLDLNTVRTRSAPIIGWPNGIRAALNTLEI